MHAGHLRSRLGRDELRPARLLDGPRARHFVGAERGEVAVEALLQVHLVPYPCSIEGGKYGLRYRLDAKKVPETVVVQL